MAHPGLPLLHPLLLEEAVVEIKDSQHSHEHHGPLIPTLHQDNNLSLIYFSKRRSPLFFLSQMSMCTSSNLLDAEHDTVLGHACGESVFSCQFEAGFMVRRKLLRDLAEVTFSLASVFISAWRPSPYWRDKKCCCVYLCPKLGCSL